MSKELSELNKIIREKFLNEDFLKDTYTKSEDYLRESYINLVTSDIESKDVYKNIKNTRAFNEFRKYFDKESTYNTFVKYCKIGDLQTSEYDKDIDEFLNKLLEFQEFKKAIFTGDNPDDVSTASTKEIEQFKETNGVYEKDFTDIAEEKNIFKYKTAKLFYSIKGFIKTMKMNIGDYYITDQYKNSRFMYAGERRFFKATAAQISYVTYTDQREIIFPYWQIGILNFKRG